VSRVRRESAEVVIIGAGPAGMSAAVAAASAGAEVVVIDEAPRPGGRVGGAPAATAAAGAAVHPGPYDDRLARLTRVYAEQPLTHLAGTTVWGLFDDRLVATDHPEHPLIEAQYLVIASGAYETPLAFPGWTLPGVMTVGGLQQLRKRQGLVPRGRVLLSGTGPFLYLAADQLAADGVEIVAVADSASRADWIRWGLRLARLPALAREGLGYLGRLRRRGIPLLYRRAAVRALGEERVEAAVIARLDNMYQIRAGSELELAVDVLAVNIGFTPATDLTHLAGCQHRLDRRTHHWLPVVDSLQRTSQSGIYAAGDCGGIGYLPKNLLQGELAGTDAALRLDRILETEARERIGRLQRQLRASAWYGQLLSEIYAFHPGRTAWADAGTVICRCEGVTREAIVASMEAQVSVELDAVKRLSRAGMGPCQGKLCFPTILGMLAQELDADRWRAQDYSARPPLKPISMHTLAELAETVQAQEQGEAA